MIHPDTELRLVDPVVGWGVFATRRLPRGTLTWVRDVLDQRIDPAMLDALGQHWHRWSDHHTFADAEGHRVLCWDLCRSMNHSCDPNCAGTELDFEIAIRDIEAGEELTNDYGTLRIEDREGFPCCCGTGACRRHVRPDLAAIERLRPAVLAALRVAPRLDQPLAELLDPRWHKITLSRLAPRESPAARM